MPNWALCDGVYGEDNRFETRDVSSKYQKVARSVAAMINKADLENYLSNAQFDLSSTLGHQRELCTDEKFYHQPSLAECTGFLISPNELLTAGHCIEFNDDPCADFTWVFDYKKNTSSDIYFSESEVVGCKSIKKLDFDPTDDKDYAIIELEKSLDRPFLKPYLGRIQTGDKVFSVGHPNGLPQKVVLAGEILSLEKSFFGFVNKIYNNLDLFHGNSGSPIMHEATGTVLGLAIRGEDDYHRSNTCFSVTVYSEKPTLSEIAMPIGKVSGF